MEGEGGLCVADQTGQVLTSAGLRRALGVHLRRRYISLGVNHLRPRTSCAERDKRSERNSRLCGNHSLSLSFSTYCHLSHIPGGGSSMGFAKLTPC